VERQRRRARPAGRAPRLKQPDVTVAAVVETDGRFLLVEERIAGRLVLNQPAGHVEPGETILAGVVREVREETAWHFEPHWLLGLYQWHAPRGGRTFLRIAFLGAVRDHDPHQPLDRDIIATHWLSAAELRRQEARLRSPLVLRCVDDYLAGERSALAAVATLDRDSALAFSRTAGVRSL
jgi:8-oxo-dGTP pyrophosphatase MutT (NUDIX family)